CNRVTIKRHDNGNRSSCLLGGTIYIPTCDNDVYLETHKFGEKVRKPLCFSLGHSILNDNVFSLHVPKLAQTLPESLDAVRDNGGRGTDHKSYPRDFLRLLRLSNYSLRQGNNDDQKKHKTSFHKSLLGQGLTER